MKSLDEIKCDIESKTGAQLAVEGSSFVVPKEKLRDVGQFLKISPEYQMDFLSCVTGVDYVQHLEAVYHLYSMTKKHGPIVLKARTDRTEAKLPSVTPIWRSAEYQEREAYDLVGIHFEGHPDLRRILMWEGFQFHPLRKDYVQEDQDREIQRSA